MMTDDERNELLKKLAFKTPDKYIGKDPKGNRYVTARYVQNVLDTIIGPAFWSDSYRVIDVIHRPDGTARLCVECSLTVLGVTKTDVGYGEILISEKVDDRTGELKRTEYGAYEKEAYSIALKRAGVKFGIARDLYNDGMPIYNVEPEQPDSIPGEDDEPEKAPEAAKTPPTRAADNKQVETPAPPQETPQNGAQGDTDDPEPITIEALMDKRCVDLAEQEATFVRAHSMQTTGLNPTHWLNRLKKYWPTIRGNIRMLTITVGEFLSMMAESATEALAGEEAG